ncbi:MAG: histidine--tRNA ligase, partial [Ignavibacteria bacterium]|nr:histidine--tRNA ligase [Ignavibacteria bacterium]
RERPQAGRFREFSQFGAEAIGSGDYLIDVEMIVLADTILNNFGINDAVIRINTIGSLSEREIYLKELKKYLSAYENDLSDDSRKRLIKNPLRILDSKDKTDIEILKNAPLLFDYLKADTKIFFESILANLKMLNINYEVDYKLVRGLDYYTSTTFEFMSDSLGAQNTLIGGGRYDILVEQLGGKPTAAIGFAAGMERLGMILEAKKYKFPSEESIKIYIVTMDEKCKILAFGILNELRNSGIKCETDYLNRSVKSQMKEANKTDAEFVIVIGENEIKENKAKLKKMSNGTETEVTDLKNIKDYLI